MSFATYLTGHSDVFCVAQMGWAFIGQYKTLPLMMVSNTEGGHVAFVSVPGIKKKMATVISK